MELGRGHKLWEVLSKTIVGWEVEVKGPCDRCGRWVLLQHGVWAMLNEILGIWPFLGQNVGA